MLAYRLGEGGYVDGRALAVGVPRKKWLVAKLGKIDACPT